MFATPGRLNVAKPSASGCVLLRTAASTGVRLPTNLYLKKKQPEMYSRSSSCWDTMDSPYQIILIYMGVSENSVP